MLPVVCATRRLVDLCLWIPTDPTFLLSGRFRLWDCPAGLSGMLFRDCRGTVMLVCPDDDTAILSLVGCAIVSAASAT